MDRKTLLQRLVDTRFDGSQAEFARAIKRSPAQVNQWLSGHRKLGDAGARHIELTLGLAPGYFDDKCGRPPIDQPNTEPGPDEPGNMQWQTVEAAKLKDRDERRQCAAYRRAYSSTR